MKNNDDAKTMNSDVLTFRAEIKILKINPYVIVSASRAKRLRTGWKKPMPVLVKVNGKPEKYWRINLMPIGDGSFYLYLHGSVRKESGTKVGDRVLIDILFDSKYRVGPVGITPKWFTSELDKNPNAKKSWKALAPSRKKEIVRYLKALKSEESRQRNIARAISVLSGNRERFMARDWENGK